MDAFLESVRTALAPDFSSSLASHVTLDTSFASRPDLLQDVATFLRHLTTGSVACLAPVVAATRQLTDDASHLPLFDSSLATLWSVIYHTSHSFERAMESGTLKHLAPADVADYREAVLTFFAEHNRRAFDADLTLSSQEAIQRQLVECQAGSLQCFLRLWRAGVEGAGILHQRNRNVSSNEYLDLCHSVAHDVCDASETAALEFCAFVSTGMEKEGQEQEKVHAMQLLQQIVGQRNRQSSAKLVFHLLPVRHSLIVFSDAWRWLQYLLPACLHEKVSVRKVLYSFVITAACHCLLQDQTCDINEVLTNFIQRGMSDKNANVRLKVVADLQSGLSDVFFRKIPLKERAFQSLHSLWMALLERVLDESKSVRVKTLQGLNKHLKDFIALPDWKSTIFDAFLLERSDWVSLCLQQLMAVIAASPDSALYLESSRKTALEILQSIIQLPSMQKTFLELLCDLKAIHSPSIFAPVLNAVPGSDLLEAVLAVFENQDSQRCMIWLESFLGVLPAEHLKLFSEDGQCDQEKSIAYVSLQCLYSFLSHDDSSLEVDRSCRLKIAIRGTLYFHTVWTLVLAVLRDGVKRSGKLLHRESLMSLLYATAKKLLQCDGSDEMITVASIIWIVEAMGMILEWLQEIDDEHSDSTESNSGQDCIDVYGHLLLQLLMTSVQLQHSLPLQAALAEAICICPQSKQELVSILSRRSVPVETDQRIVLCCSIVSQECNAMNASLIRMQQQFHNAQAQELHLDELTKEEMDDFVQSASHSFLNDLISSNDANAKFEWLLEVTGDPSCPPDIKGYCFHALWRLANISLIFKERLVEWIRMMLADAPSRDWSVALCSLSCCAEILRGTDALERNIKQQLSVTLSSFITSLSTSTAAPKSDGAEVLLKHALFVYGLFFHNTGSLIEEQSFIAAVAHCLLSCNEEVTAVVKRLVMDQMLSVPKDTHKLVTAYITAVDICDAVELAHELATIRSECIKACHSKVSDGQLAKDMVRFYTEIESSTLQDAALEFLCHLKSSSQALTCILQYWKKNPEKIPHHESPNAGKWKQFVGNYIAAPDGQSNVARQSTKEANWPPHDIHLCGEKAQAKLLSLLAAQEAKHHNAKPKFAPRHSRRHDKTTVSDGDEEEMATFLVSLNKTTTHA